MNIVNRILGESDSVPQFSEEFKGVLELVSFIHDLMAYWFDHAEHAQDADEKLNTECTHKLRKGLKAHIEKWGDSALTRRIARMIHNYSYLPQGKGPPIVWMNEEFWHEISFASANQTVYAISSGKLSPYSLAWDLIRGEPLYGLSMAEKTPENLPIAKAMSDIMGVDLDTFYAWYEDGAHENDDPEDED